MYKGNISDIYTQLNILTYSIFRFERLYAIIMY